MGPPLLAGTWWCQVNVPFNETGTAANINNSWAHCLKEMLKGTVTLSGSSTSSSLRPDSSKWTVEGSSDGVNGALDGVDRLTGSVPNSFDASKWVHAVSGSLHSWIVLKSPDALGPVWLCIDACAAATNSWGVIGSRTGFVAVTAMNRARPITNNGWAAGTTTDPVQSTNVAMLSDQTTGQVWRANICVDTSGAFHFFTSRNGTGFANHYLSTFRTVDRNPNDRSYDTFTAFHVATSGRGAPTGTGLGQASANCSGRTADGTTVFSAGGIVMWGFGSTAANFAGAATVDQGATDFRALPIYIWTGVTGEHSWRGRVPDAWVVGAVPVRDQFPTGSVTQTVVGDLLLPCSLLPTF